MKKAQGRPMLADQDKKHQIGGRVSWQAYQYCQEEISEPIGVFLDRCILAFIAGQTPAKKSRIKANKKLDKEICLK